MPSIVSSRVVVLLHVLHLTLAAAVLGQAVFHLAANPKIERAMLLYFVPPLIAVLLTAVNLLNGTNPAVITLCQTFLSLIAVAVVLGELPFILPNLKPQFPGIPPQQDRILVFYFFAYFLYLWVLLPPYLLGTSLYHHYRRRYAAISLSTSCLGAITWLSSVVLLIALLPRFAAKLF